MKSLLFSIAIFLSLNSFATQWTVSNYASIPGQFSNISSAISAASDYDTLLVQGSPTTYSDFSITRPLYIIGAGHHSGSVTGYATIVNSIVILQSGSGSTLEGFSITSLSNTNYSETVTNFTLRNCYLSTVNFWATFMGSLFEGNVLSGQLSFANNINSEMIVRNNIFLANVAQSSYGVISSIRSGVILDHNAFISAYSNHYPFTDVSLATITNNFFLNFDTSFLNGNANGYYNCVCNNNATYLCSANIPSGSNTGTGNLNGVSPLFLNYPVVPAPWLWTYDLHIDPTSLLTGAATDGTDIGLYGGGFTFHQSGEPFGVPVVRVMNINNSVVPLNGTLDVHFEATSPR
jgi:hypothetical protein